MVPKWQQNIIKKFWTFNHKGKVGRPPVDYETRHLILSIKNDNLEMGKMIQ